MGHIGMMASRRTEQSGFGIKGKAAADAFDIVEGARAFVDAGVFAFILEQVPTELAAYLTSTLPVNQAFKELGLDPSKGLFKIKGGGENPFKGDELVKKAS